MRVSSMAEKHKNTLGKGYVHVYTGNGKGKTTAALGLAFRAMGSGLKTYIGQFMKGQRYGELDAALKVPGFITIEQYGKDTFVHVKMPPEPADVRLAQTGLSKAKQAMLSGRYNIVILDEIVTAHHFHLVSLDEMLEMVRQKPNGVELVFTGRYAPKELIDIADIVTEMTEVKHYYQKDVPAREGIEK
jgi:cob(I)alamin adenosyltransferase